MESPNSTIDPIAEERRSFAHAERIYREVYGNVGL